MTITGKPVQYKGEDLDPEKGPGLGCFRFQLVVLAIFVVLTPLSVAWQWPETISTILLFAVLVLLLVTGQTIIFLLRLVAADRRGRRRPLGSATKTVGELEDATAAGTEDAVTAADDSVEEPDAESHDGPGDRAAPGAVDRLWSSPAMAADATVAANRTPTWPRQRPPTDDDDPPPADEEAMRQ